MKAPPRLVARTLAVTFVTVAIILSLVFLVLTVDVRDRVRASETEKLQVTGRLFTALEARRQQEQLAAITTLAENPTLKAALDTYVTESSFSALAPEQAQALRDTVEREIEKLAAMTAADVLRLGALLHDIGKIGLSDEVLRKPGSLTTEEYEQIKRHPALGARILRQVPFLAPHLPIVELHHERPDGRGYPFGLRDQDIPLAARIVHVADAYDAMTSARAYRRARPGDEALRELWRCAGTEFHAEIVGALAVALPGVTSQIGEPALESIGG